jgi:hypothetical protein
MTSGTSASVAAKTIYFCAINLNSGKIVRQERDTLANILDGDPDDLGIEREKNGIWFLAACEECDCEDPIDPDPELTCFSLQSWTDAIALCLEEFSIFRDSGWTEYCTRCREAPIGGVDWPCEYDQVNKPTRGKWIVQVESKPTADFPSFNESTAASFGGQLSWLDQGVQ